MIKSSLKGSIIFVPSLHAIIKSNFGIKAFFCFSWLRSMHEKPCECRKPWALLSPLFLPSSLFSLLLSEFSATISRRQALLGLKLPSQNGNNELTVVSNMATFFLWNDHMIFLQITISVYQASNENCPALIFCGILCIHLRKRQSGRSIED